MDTMMPVRLSLGSIPESMENFTSACKRWSLFIALRKSLFPSMLLKTLTLAEETLPKSPTGRLVLEAVRAQSMTCPHLPYGCKLPFQLQIIEPPPR